MKALFDVVNTVSTWLRQQYTATSSGGSSRVFWNQIMLVIGIIMLKQEIHLPTTLDNLDRYTPIPKSSIYRTLKVLENRGILKCINTEYDFMNKVPQDILTLSMITTHDKAPIDLSGLVKEITTVVKSEFKDIITSLPLQQDQLDQVTRRIDKIQPEKKKLSMLENLVGEGFL